MNAAKNALKAIVEVMGPEDRFSLSRFGNTTEHRCRGLWRGAPPAKASAQRWVDDLRAAQKAEDEARAMLSDPDMRELAEAELFELKTKIPALEQEIRIALLPKDAADERDGILEIRPAAGGDEAGLFAAELFAMYQKYAASRGWRFRFSANQTTQ